MPKKSRRTLVASIIPTYSISNNVQDYKFSVTQATFKEATVLDYAIFSATRARADVIVLVCLPEQVPYFKIRYGDIILDMQYLKVYERVRGLESKARPVSIYYISVAQKFAGLYDTDVFAAFHAANVLIKALDETFTVISPTLFLFIFPYIMVSPEWYMLANNTFDLRNLQAKERETSKYQFVTEIDVLPENSHSAISVEDVQQIWGKLYEMYRACKSNKIKREEILNLKFPDLVKDYLNPDGNYIINSEYVYDLRHWYNYVKFLNSLVDKEDDFRLKTINALVSKYITNYPKLTYHLSGPMIRDNPYLLSQKMIKRKDLAYEQWKRFRTKVKRVEKK